MNIWLILLIVYVVLFLGQLCFGMSDRIAFSKENRLMDKIWKWIEENESMGTHTRVQRVDAYENKLQTPYGRIECDKWHGRWSLIDNDYHTVIDKEYKGSVRYDRILKFMKGA